MCEYTGRRWFSHDAVLLLQHKSTLHSLAARMHARCQQQCITALHRHLCEVPITAYYLKVNARRRVLQQQFAPRIESLFIHTWHSKPGLWGDPQRGRRLGGRVHSHA